MNALARAHGLTFADYSMPANNRILVWTEVSGRATGY